MKVLNLRCVHAHGFEGWFGSEQDYAQQSASGLLSCPLCGSLEVERLPSAPRLNLSGARDPEPSEAPGTSAVAVAGHDAEQQLQAQWLRAMRELIKRTEDVGDHFPDEARRIHYGETPPRGIRGQATAEQQAELSDEGIEVLALPIPALLSDKKH